MMVRGFRYYFDVVTVLAGKDFKLRYKNSVLGFLWSLLNPLANLLILTLVFSVLMHSTNALLLLVGLLFWRFFQIATSQSLGSIVGNPSLVTKVALPRYLIVLSNNLANLLAACLEVAAFIPVLFALGAKFSVYTLFLPVIILLEFGLIFGLSLCLASLNVLYRDLHEVWEIVTQLGFFLSPIVYTAISIPPRFQFAYSLNPVTRIIESGRGILLYGRLPMVYDIEVIVLFVLIFVSVGFLVFHSLEDKFAEEL